MIKNMRSEGTVVSYDNTISIAKGLILANDRTLLKENGGNIDLTTSWAHSKGHCNDQEYAFRRNCCEL